MMKNHSMQMSQGSNYLPLLIMTAVSFIYMYFFMYAMIDGLPHLYNNINQIYMAGLMAAPMAIVELVIMRSMYNNRRMNLIVIVMAALATIAFWFLIREQAAVGDRQFLRSMIPHHASAILMCDQATISDQRIQNLCKEIVDGQKREIAEMESILAGPLN